MPAYRAVLFDFFGTLTQAVQRGSGHRAIAQVLGCDPAALADVLDRSFYLRATGALGGAEATMRWAGEQAGGQPSDTAVRTARRRRVDAVRADTHLRPEAVPTLRSLRRSGLRTGLVSDCTHELPAFLPRLPVAPLLDVAVLSVRLGRCKPDPEIFLAACRQLDIAPRHCLYVGDGGSQELTGASRAGLTAVRLAAPDLAGHLVFNPDVDWTGPTVTSLREVPALATASRAPESVTPGIGPTGVGGTGVGGTGVGGTGVGGTGVGGTGVGGTGVGPTGRGAPGSRSPAIRPPARPAPVRRAAG